MAQQDLRSGDGPIALILSPTRELAKQVDEVAKLFGKCCGINSVAVYGGADKNVQISQLNKGTRQNFPIIPYKIPRKNPVFLTQL